METVIYPCPNLTLPMLVKPLGWLKECHEKIVPTAKDAKSKSQPVLFEVPSMGLLPDTLNFGLRMHRECRERFSTPPTSKETTS